jgi:NAD(P)-dependent dehydrogenase (short-subunit alcohol dehydrogenase family)
MKSKVILTKKWAAMEKLVEGSAFVTGGGSGNGRAIALAFARRGTPVAVMDLRTQAAEAVAAEIRSGGGRASALIGDVSVWDDTSNALSERP